MGKGSGSPQSTVVQTDLPQYVQPYFEGLLDRTATESQRGYVPYEGPRISGVNQDTNYAQNMMRNDAVNGIAGIGDSRNTMLGAMDTTQNLINNSGPNTFTESGFTGTDVNARDTGTPYGFTGHNYEDAGTFTGGSVDQYMNPYLDNVLNERKDAARLSYDRSGAARDFNAVNAGAFGGARHGVADYLAEEGLQTRLDQIDAEGRTAAFDSASGMFNTDRTARLGIDQLRGSEGRWQQNSQAYEDARSTDRSLAEGARVDDTLVAENARVQQMGAAERARYEAAMASDNNALRDFQLGATDTLVGQAGDTAQLGRMDAQYNQSAADRLGKVGEFYRAREQTGMDLNYEDFVRQRDYDREQLNFYSGILRGVPVAPSTETTRMLAHNPMSQLAGAGLSSLGLYNAFNNNGGTAQ